MSIVNQVIKLTGDTNINNSDKLYTIKLGDYHQVILYETRSDYLYMVEVIHGKVTEITTYEYKGVQEC